jgi:hypothetical protein
MASPNYIPYLGFWGQLTKVAASIDTVTAVRVTGHISHDGGLPIPFDVVHEGHESFLVGTHRFYFKDWTRTK